MHTLGYETVSGGDRCQNRSQFFQGYFHRCPTVFADQMLMIRLFGEVVHAGAVSEMNMMQVAELLKHIEGPIDG